METINITDDTTDADDSREVVQLSDSNEEDSSVLIDTDGQDVDEESLQNVTDESILLIQPVPSYTSDFTGYLTEKEFSMDTGKQIVNDARPKKNCFNCLGDHNLSECKERINQANIRRNKSTIMAGRTNNRYHQEIENKFGQLQPGKISSELRYALGLRSHEAPKFVYKMRYLGYPLGWLKEAEVVRTSLALFDGDGKVLSHPEEEEGEMDSHVKYNPEKLIEFPGFNVPFPDGIKDEHRYLNMPPMNPMHSKSEFERFMKENRATKYKRKKLTEVPLTPKSSQHSNLPPSDMDIDGEQISPAKFVLDDSLQEERTNPTTPPTQSTAPGKEIEEGELSDENSSNFFTIDTKPVDESSQADSSSSSLPNEQTASPSSPKVEQSTAEEPRSNPAIKRKSISIEENSDSQSSNSSGLQTKRHHRSHSKGFSLGAHIPESITAFVSLPEANKWAVEISDHINFENLPDALGAWNKMKNLVCKVKNKMSVLHADDD